MENEYAMRGQMMKFVTPEPDPKDICNLCGGHVGKDNLIKGKEANICFDCSDIAKELADKERARLSKKEIERIAAVISAGDKGLIDTGMATAYMYAERLYKAGYRKSAPEIKQTQEG